MTAPVPPAGDPVVVELGPGTGGITAAIQRRLGGRGRHLAVELNPVLAGRLAVRHPEVEIIEGDAAALDTLLAARGIAGVDVVISGLPWVAYTVRPDGRSLPDIVAGVLHPTGVLTQFAYVWTTWAPPARRQRAQLRACFGEVVTSATIWPNLPPAQVHTARHPRVVGTSRATTPAAPRS